MGINTAINNFEAELVDLVNRYQIPIGCKRVVLASVLQKVEEVNEQAIQKEAAEEAEKAQSEEGKEDAVSEN